MENENNIKKLKGTVLNKNEKNEKNGKWWKWKKIMQKNENGKWKQIKKW